LTLAAGRATSAGPTLGQPVPYPYAILDVFTERPLAGNPLAVVFDAGGLDEQRMQAIASEFNLSETAFVLPAQNPVHSARLRIFTPLRELPFAGHPIVGTAIALARRIAAGDPERHEQMLVLEAPVGAIRCGVFVKGERSGHAIFDAPQLPAAVAAEPDREAVAAALGLVPAEIGFENHQPSAFSAGLAFTFVPVRDLAVIARAKPVLSQWSAAFGAAAGAAYVYCRQTEVGDNHFHGRMFAPAFGFSEDPATGGAAAAFAGVVRRFDRPPNGGHRYVVEQGFEMGRPSEMVLELDVEEGAIAAVRVGGDAVVVAEGMLAV
jgi:trans-2,3-dihydro-3-hydroxyanthranilate isomerase